MGDSPKRRDSRIFLDQDIDGIRSSLSQTEKSLLTKQWHMTANAYSGEFIECSRSTVSEPSISRSTTLATVVEAARMFRDQVTGIKKSEYAVTPGPPQDLPWHLDEIVESQRNERNN